MTVFELVNTIFILLRQCLDEGQLRRLIIIKNRFLREIINKLWADGWVLIMKRRISLITLRFLNYRWLFMDRLMMAITPIIIYILPSRTVSSWVLFLIITHTLIQIVLCVIRKSHRYHERIRWNNNFNLLMPFWLLGNLNYLVAFIAMLALSSSLKSTNAIFYLYLKIDHF